MKGKNKIITSFPLILFFMSCCFSMNLWAQEATIRGSVKDTDGEPIESVALYFVLEAKGIERQAKTNKSGSYYLRGLVHGIYNIRCVKENYVTVEDVKKINLGKNDLDIVMQSESEIERKMLKAEGGESYVEGYDAFDAGDYESAIESLKKVVESMPDNKEAYVMIGRSYLELKEYDLAIENYEKVLKLDRYHSSALFDLGSAWVQKGDLDKASEYFKRGLQLRPNDPDAHYNIGIIYFQANKTDKAIEELKIAVELKETFALAHKTLGYALIQKNQLNEAITHLEKYIEIDPEGVDANQIKEIIKTLMIKEERQ